MVEAEVPEPAKHSEREQQEADGEQEAEREEEGEHQGEAEFQEEAEHEEEAEPEASKKAPPPLVIPDEPLSVVAIDPGKRAVMTTCQGAPPAFRVPSVLTALSDAQRRP